MLNKLISLPYELARRPLTALEDRLPLSETSRPRVVLDRTLGSADKIAGSVLRNPEIASRGQERLERTATLVEAARLEAEAKSRREQARSAAEEGLREADSKRQAAQERATSGLQEADAVEARGKQEARTRAAKTAAQKKAAAERRAESRAEVVEQRKERVESAAQAKKQAAGRKAKAELDEARETKQEAASDRADAERLDGLAEAKKKARKRS